MIKIDLTDEQLEQLEPLFEEIRNSNEVGILSAIAAQIYVDGMVVKVMVGDKAKALAMALGKNTDRCAVNSEERMQQHQSDIQAAAGGLTQTAIE